MNAKNLITVCGLNFVDECSALMAVGFKASHAEILRADWTVGAPYYEQPCTLRDLCGDVVLVRDLNLPESTVLDTETLPGFYLVEARTLEGAFKLYAVRFEPKETGPAVETWTEIRAGAVRVPLATDDEGDTRAVVVARTENNDILVTVTSTENAAAFRDYARAVIHQAAKI